MTARREMIALETTQKVYDLLTKAESAWAESVPPGENPPVPINFPIVRHSVPMAFAESGGGIAFQCGEVAIGFALPIDDLIKFASDILRWLDESPEKRLLGERK